MNPRLRRIVVVLLLVAATAWSVSQHSRSRDGPALAVSAVTPDVLGMGSLTLEPCDIGKRGVGAATLRAYCTSLKVPENHRAPGGRQIRLRIAVVRAEAAQAKGDLVTFLDGGPGGAASEDYPSIAGAFDPLRKHRAVLLVDQRGTGGSNPLDCDDDGSPTVARAVDMLRQCVARLAARAATQYYTTSDAVEDLEIVRRALGAPQLDLIAVSYGTRLAQQYARRYPAAVRALVLDSPVPNALALGSEHAQNLEAVLQSLFARCRTERACAERYGDPYLTLRRLQQRLHSHPQRLTLRDPYTFSVQQKSIDEAALVQLVRLYAYSPFTAALLPYVLQEADAGHYEPLLGQAQVVIGDVSDSLTGGLALSVTCAEDADRLRVNPVDAGTVMGNGLTEWLLAACPAWPHGARPADFAAPLAGPVPVLVLAGEHDPVTPPRYAREIVRTLPHARLLELKGQGHGLLPVGCIPRLLDEFLGTLDAGHLDARCLDILAQTPFFIDANGSNP